MQSIRNVFYIGYGPSSSHTIGPYNATKYLLNKYPNIKDVKVTLFGSLASTGRGHLTDYVLDRALKGVSHSISFKLSLVKWTIFNSWPKEAASVLFPAAKSPDITIRLAIHLL